MRNLSTKTMQAHQPALNLTITISSANSCHTHTNRAGREPCLSHINLTSVYTHSHTHTCINIGIYKCSYRRTAPHRLSATLHLTVAKIIICQIVVVPENRYPDDWHLHFSYFAEPHMQLLKCANYLPCYVTA